MLIATVDSGGAGADVDSRGDTPWRLTVSSCERGLATGSLHINHNEPVVFIVKLCSFLNLIHFNKLYPIKTKSGPFV
jgi:hypothetical protein